MAIPKHAFVCWLGVKNCLLKGNRMLKLGFESEVKCLFCRKFIECRDHMFFDCGFDFGG